MLAPAAFGGSVVAGVAAMLVSGYRIVDCFQYRTERGACDQVIEDNTLAVVAGAAAIAGSFGGFFTYNEQLESPWYRRRRTADPAAAEPDPQPEPEPEPLPNPFFELEPLAAPIDEPDPVDRDLRADVAELLGSQGMTQQQIADQLGVSRSTVQRLLQQ
jgi:hypothetical protein